MRGMMRMWSDHEHAAPLRVVQSGFHHEQLHRLGWVAGQELDQRLSEWAASLEQRKYIE